MTLTSNDRRATANIEAADLWFSTNDDDDNGDGDDDDNVNDDNDDVLIMVTNWKTQVQIF